MKALSVLWGLFFDDFRLVLILAITLILTAVCKFAHWTSVSPYVFVVGLLVALFVSIEHQLKLKTR
jgi:hypothetical protein